MSTTTQQVSYRCNRGQLLQAMNLASRVMPRRQSRPQLGNFLLSLVEGNATLTATDLDAWVQLPIGAEVHGNGSVLLPRHAVNLLQRLDSTHVRMVAIDGGTMIYGDQVEAKLVVEGSPDEFPALPEVKPHSSLTLNGPSFRQALVRTAFACDPESARYALAGVLLDADHDPAVIGTDGRRLSQQEVEGNGHTQHDAPPAIIPMRIAKLLCDLQFGLDVQVRVHDSYISIRSAGWLVMSELVEGRYPKWRDVVTQKTPDQVVPLPVGGLLAALRVALTFRTDERKGTTFTFSEDTLALTADTEIGTLSLPVNLGCEVRDYSTLLDAKFATDFLENTPARCRVRH